MYEARGQDNIANPSIQTYEGMETFKLNVVNEKRNFKLCKKRNLSWMLKKNLVENCGRKRIKLNFHDLKV